MCISVEFLLFVRSIDLIKDDVPKPLYYYVRGTKVTIPAVTMMKKKNWSVNCLFYHLYFAGRTILIIIRAH